MGNQADLFPCWMVSRGHHVELQRCSNSRSEGKGTESRKSEGGEGGVIDAPLKKHEGNNVHFNN